MRRGFKSDEQAARIPSSGLRTLHFHRPLAVPTACVHRCLKSPGHRSHRSWRYRQSPPRTSRQTRNVRDLLYPTLETGLAVFGQGCDVYDLFEPAASRRAKIVRGKTNRSTSSRFMATRNTFLLCRFRSRWPAIRDHKRNCFGRRTLRSAL